jgi:hypothetical protein
MMTEALTYFVALLPLAGALPLLFIRSGRTTKLVLRRRSIPLRRDRQALAA